MIDDNKGLTISLGKADRKQIISQKGPTIRIQGQPASKTSVRGLDLVFVIDTTGSMSDKIEGLLATCNKFVDELAKLSFSHRIAVVAFGDLTVPGDDIKVFAFTENIQDVKGTLTSIPRYGGGANSGESSLEAVATALALPFRPQIVKALVLITDEPALQHQLTVPEMTRRLKKNEVLTFVVSPPETYFKQMAATTGGIWYQISSSTEFTGLLEMFRNVASTLSSVVADVYRLGSGSVSKYLQIKASGK